MKVFVGFCFFLFCGTLVSAQDEKLLFEWEGPVLNYSGEEILVNESTVVMLEKQLMVMKAAAQELRTTPAYRSDSMHDFQKNLVALRPLGSRQCFVGPVKSNFNDTLTELRRRSEEGSPVRENRPMLVEGGSGGGGGSAVDSRALRRFCRGRRIFRVTDVPLDQLPEPWIRWPPLYCIYGPVDIYIQVDATIEGNRDVPRFVAGWRGPYAPFP